MMRWQKEDAWQVSFIAAVAGLSTKNIGKEGIVSQAQMIADEAVKQLSLRGDIFEAERE